MEIDLFGLHFGDWETDFGILRGIQMIPATLGANNNRK
jgi:hypothetical protein